MTNKEFGRELHDRLTRGEALSNQEQAELEQWYARLDRDEGLCSRGQSLRRSWPS